MATTNFLKMEYNSYEVEISIILSTYNALEWLKKSLAGYEVQTFKNFEIIIADDGSSDEIKFEIAKYIKDSKMKILHVWHEDKGFRKTIILNKALLSCKGDYIIVSDGDCIPRKDFVQVHNSLKEQGCFLSGGYFKLPMDISYEISIEDILNQNCFNIEWLKEKWLKWSFKNSKLTSTGIKSTLLNKFTPTNSSWNGHNSSGWKNDIFKVNGFDERMQYGGEDRELGDRLHNTGIKSKQIRYSAICVHLEHSRSYVNKEALEINEEIRRITKKNRLVLTMFGIRKE